MGLEYEDEVRKIRKENIQNAISKKEKVALDEMELSALRALDDDDEIPEPEKKDLDKSDAGGLPGESSLPGMEAPPPSLSRVPEPPAPPTP
jgi:hypothetical protein